MASVPFTWEEMRALGEPTLQLAACEICSDIPDYVRDNFPAAVGRLESAGLPEDDKNESYHRCPLCHRLYRWSYSPYEYLAWGSEDAYSAYSRLDPRALFHSFTSHRIADERFARALAALEPGLAVEKRRIVDGGRDFYPHHRIIQLACGDRRVWVALSDDGEVERCTLAALARFATAEPPPKLDERWRAIEYADFVDRVTREGDCTVVDAFDKISWRAELTDEDRAYIAELRTASRVEPQHVAEEADRVVIRRWVVEQQRLICRVLTVWPSGRVQREDAVIGEAIPVR